MASPSSLIGDDIDADGEEAALSPELEPFFQKLAAESSSVPRKMSKFLSYAKRSLRLSDDNVVQSIWTEISRRVLSEEAREGMTTTDSALGRVQVSLGPKAAVVHRLDMETSGILVVAKDPVSCEALNRQFRERTVEKVYIALVHGRMDDVAGVVDLPLKADLDNRPRQVVDHISGKPALTEWRVLDVLKCNKCAGPHMSADTSTSPRAAQEVGSAEAGHVQEVEAVEPPGTGCPACCTRLELQPRTGRTHQLRVHLASLGHPIVGDSLYASQLQLKVMHGQDQRDQDTTADGNAPATEKPGQEIRLHLHAERMSISSPATGARVHLFAACPF